MVSAYGTGSGADKANRTIGTRMLRLCDAQAGS